MVELGLLAFYARSSETGIFMSSTTGPSYQDNYSPKFQPSMSLSLLFCWRPILVAVGACFAGSPAFRANCNHSEMNSAPRDLSISPQNG